MILKSQILKTSVTILLVALTITILLAQERIGKEIHKTYPVTEGTNLSIDNKYGNIDIRNWEKNTIDIVVQIKLFNVNDKKADEILKMIEINHYTKENKIVFKTKFVESFGVSLMKTNNKNKLFEVNYIINMPHDIEVNLVNKYGNVFIDKLSVASKIDIKYGKLQANIISSVNKDNMSRLSLAYSDANIEQCSWLKANIRYSKFNIDKSKALIIVSQYSKVFLTKGSSLVTVSKYDTYNIGDFINFITEAGYCNFKINSVSKLFKAETEYTDVKINHITDKFESININSKYGAYKLAIDKNSSYYLKGTVNYGDIIYPNNSRVSRNQKMTELQVDGYVGSNTQTEKTVSVNSKYCTVKLTE